MFTYCHHCTKKHDSPVTVCSNCKSEWDYKKKMQFQRSEDLKPYTSTSHLFNGVYAPSKVERDHANN